MITFLSQLFIKDNAAITSPKVRQSYGILCGAVGIFFNVILFIGKFLAGFFSNSISITADAFNNLSDAGSSIITLIGFKLSGQKPDPEHPFGHGRIEYISGFIVSLSIIIMAFELAKTSIQKIFKPEPMEFSFIIVFILIISILVKLYMAYYNTKTSKLISSTAMKATAIDSVSDCVATCAVLAVTLITHFTKTTLPLDGICGIFVGISIFFSGINAAKDTITPLLGQPPSKELVQRIEEIVMKHDSVLGIHDLIVHDYGPGRLIISLHAEVPASGDVLSLHDTIDNIEKHLQEELNCVASIHMDPIRNEDTETLVLKQSIQSLLQDIDQTLTLHDFRIVSGPTHTNILFDLVIPFSCSQDDSELLSLLRGKIYNINPKYYLVVQIDRSYL